MGSHRVQDGQTQHDGLIRVDHKNKWSHEKKNCGSVCYVPWLRGDWKWLKEAWNLRHWWRHRHGICFKCKATSAPGPHVYLGLPSDYLFVMNLDLPMPKSMLFFGGNHHVLFIGHCHPAQRYYDIAAFPQIPRLNMVQFFSDALMLSLLINI